MQVKETHNAIKQFQKEIYEAEDWNTVQKLYRQCRMWVRGQVSYAHALTKEQGWYVNKKMNATRKEVLAKWRESHKKEYSHGRKEQSCKNTDRKSVV